jgi:hypothetical protein
VRRPLVLALVAAGVVVFVVISGLLARGFSVDSAERAAITSVVQAQAAGHTSAVVDRITDCRGSAGCQARVAANVAALRHPGAVSIIQIQTSSSFSLTSTLGTARVVWSVGGSLPIVQCLRVRHAGNILSGMRVELLVLSRRIASDASCPAHF